MAAGARRFSAAPSSLPRPLPAAVATPVHLDVTQEEGVRALFDALPPVDVLVACAGSGHFAPLTALSLADVMSQVAVHAGGLFLCARELLSRRSAPHPPAHVVVISSIAAERGFAGCGGYAAAKAAMVGLARVLDEEGREAGVRTTVVTPGAIDTPIWDTRPGFDRAAMMRPEDVAALVVDLLARPEVWVERITLLPPAGVL